jgi:hypothetical protein
MKYLSGISLFLTIVILTGCASSYHPINPERLSFQSPSECDALLMFSLYDVLAQAGNKKYPKKERKNGIRLVAIKIENQGFSDIAFNSLRFFEGDKSIDLIDIPTIHKKIKQGVVEYLFYGLLTLNITNSETSNGQTSSNTTIIPFGLAIAAGNMIGAGDANSNFKKELIRYNLIGKTISPGESVVGLIGFYSNTSAQLRVEY